MNYIIKVVSKTGKEKVVRVAADDLNEALNYLTHAERQHIVSWVAWKYDK